MKKHLLLVLLAVAGVAKAQTLEFAPVGAEWYYEKQTMFTRGYIRILVTNDTIIDGHTCAILNKESHGFNYYSQNLCHSNMGREYLTHENDSVSVFRKGRFYKMFDFGAEIGDSWTIPGDEDGDGTVVLCGKGSEIIDNVEVRYILIADELGSPYGYGNEIQGFPPDTIKVFERIGPVGSYLFPEQKVVFDYSEGGDLRCYSDTLVNVNYSNPLVDCDYINDEYTGIVEQEKKSRFFIYPNPTNKYVWVTTSEDSPISVSIFDPTGRKVHSEEVAGLHSYKIDFGFLPTGMYFITISNSHNTFADKIIIK